MRWKKVFTRWNFPQFFQVFQKVTGFVAWFCFRDFFVVKFGLSPLPVLVASEGLPKWW